MIVFSSFSLQFKASKLFCLWCLQEYLRRRRPTIPCIETSQPSSSTHSWSRSQRVYHLLLTTTCSASIMLTIFYW